MPANTIDRVHAPQYLQRFALNFKAPNLVADIVAPRLRVEKNTDKYRKFGKDALYEYDATWAPGSIPNAIKTEMSEDSYYADIRKLRHPLLDTEERNADDGFDLERRYTERVTMATQIAREKRVAVKYTTAANYPAGNVITKAGGTEWDAAGIVNTIQPITDLEILIGKILDATPGASRGDMVVVIPDTVMRKAVRQNTAIRDYIKYTQIGVITEDLLASFLGVRRIVSSLGQSAGPGPGNAALDIITGITTTYLWGDNVWVGVVDESENDLMYSFGRTFWWAPETGGQEVQIRQYRMADEGQEGDWLEAKEAVDEKIVANFAGGLLVNALA